MRIEDHNNTQSAIRMLRRAISSAMLKPRLRARWLMKAALQPIYLFADSYLLFWRVKGSLFIASIHELIKDRAPKAAYVGASNGDAPEFYEIFQAAMEGIGIRDCRMILSSFSKDDLRFINEADIILLAGGDVERGWNVFEQIGLKEHIVRRYDEGAVLIGISAGAMQLGLYGLIEAADSFNRVIDTFKLVPFIIGAHEEKQEWLSLRKAIELLDGSVRGIGIPAAGGLIYYPDQSLEAIRSPVYEFSMRDGAVRQSLLFPKQ